MYENANEKQIGFARVVTDKATFGYLADVFIDENYRGKGLSKWLMEVIMNYSELQGLRRWMLEREMRIAYMKSLDLNHWKTLSALCIYTMRMFTKNKRMMTNRTTNKIRNIK